MAKSRNSPCQPTPVAGVIGAVLAALCCAGTPVVVAAVPAAGLGFLRNDAILWPLMLASPVIVTWAFLARAAMPWKGRPLLLGVAGGVSMASGVILVHGFPAMQMTYSGATALLVATVWNVRLLQAPRRWEHQW